MGTFAGLEWIAAIEECVSTREADGFRIEFSDGWAGIAAYREPAR